MNGRLESDELIYLLKLLNNEILIDKNIEYIMVNKLYESENSDHNCVEISFFEFIEEESLIDILFTIKSRKYKFKNLVDCEKYKLEQLNIERVYAYKYKN